jgi:hypothetical protein
VTVNDIPKENVDGFIGAFYHKCYDIVKNDVIPAVLQLSQLRRGTFKLLNTANIVLLSKKRRSNVDWRFQADKLGIAKKISKILAKRLAPKLSEMVSSSQSAFVKRSCIQDNFLQVQGLLKEFHRKKANTLFIKLDIAKGFDSVSWAYLLELMERIGFSLKWRNWMSIALSTASSRVLLNGILGKPIRHERGLRQGDPISPMLFILVMGPLQWMLHLATERGVLHPISARAKGIKVSLYADEVAIFVAPKRGDIKALLGILDIFGKATGLFTNLQKT